jgi:hypothetical protein
VAIEPRSNVSRWYPTTTQIGDPGQTHRVFKQVLDQLYSLQDQHNDLKARVDQGIQAQAGSSANSSAPYPGNPATSTLLGLPVTPADPTTLADGATLKFSKSTRSFIFE